VTCSCLLVPSLSIPFHAPLALSLPRCSLLTHFPFPSCSTILPQFNEHHPRIARKTKDFVLVIDSNSSSKEKAKKIPTRRDCHFSGDCKLLIISSTSTFLPSSSWITSGQPY
jgi:hypothetical protein